MCLYSKWILPKITSQDIVCFKVLKKIGDNYFTPFMSTIVDINNPLKAEESSYSISPFTKGKGYIHSFKFLEFAWEMVFEHECSEARYVIFKCIIPKGTKYHISCNDSSFCSKQINFERIISIYELQNIY